MSKSTNKNEHFAQEFYRDQVFSNIEFADKKVMSIEFYKCSFENVDFSKTLFNSCRFEECSFLQCNLSLVKVTDTSFIDVEFSNCKMIGIDWTEAIKPLSFAFDACKLNSSIFIEMDIRNTKMTNCEIHDIDFDSANLTKVQLNNSDLKGCKFLNTDLSFADLSGAINYDINPNRNKLKKTKFTLPEALSLMNYFDVIIE